MISAWLRLVLHFPQAAKKILKEYYLKLRRDHHTKDSTPITTRQLEAMMRLTEARAKLDLSEIATGEHAQVSLGVGAIGLSLVFGLDITVESRSQLILSVIGGISL